MSARVTTSDLVLLVDSETGFADVRDGAEQNNNGSFGTLVEMITNKSNRISNFKVEQMWSCL
jgi:hypothetical protein